VVSYNQLKPGLSLDVINTHSGVSGTERHPARLIELKDSEVGNYFANTACRHTVGSATLWRVANARHKVDIFDKRPSGMTWTIDDEPMVHHDRKDVGAGSTRPAQCWLSETADHRHIDIAPAVNLKGIDRLVGAAIGPLYVG